MTSQTRVLVSQATRALLRAGPLWLLCPWQCPVSVAMHPCAPVTGLQLVVAVRAVGVVTRRLHGEDCWTGLEIGLKTQKLKVQDPEQHMNLKPKLRYIWNLNGFERSQIWYLDPKLRTEIPRPSFIRVSVHLKS